MLKLYNSLTRKKELFKPISDKKVGVYTCGPTVYWYQHIGNLRSYIFSDLLKRILVYNRFKVKHVMNYTDVGHLTSDADEGEDKMEVAVKREKKSAKDIADYYAGIFEKDCKRLNIITPDIICRATDHIKEQLEMIKILGKKGYTYKTSDGIYFDTSKLSYYGTLFGIKREGIEAGKRVAVGGKRNKTDFALWKFSEKPGVRQQEWSTDLGLGFPGWHIECSAMSSKYLGKQFDIHTGGEDHKQIHHPNEIAQSETAFGKRPWVKYWLHGAFLTFKGEKVSKSKGGLYTLSEIEELGFNALDYRYLCLNTHYRIPLNFSLKSLKSARNAYSRLKNMIIGLKSKKTKKSSRKAKEYNEYKRMFLESINDDLNLPKALSFLWTVLSSKTLGSKEKLGLAYDFDRVFGLSLKEVKKESISEEIRRLIAEREVHRKNKEFKKADEIREKLRKKGIALEDTPEGVRWKRAL